jgi:hypothetical protein
MCVHCVVSSHKVKQQLNQTGRKSARKHEFTTVNLTNVCTEQTIWALTRWAINYHTNATRGQAQCVTNELYTEDNLYPGTASYLSIERRNSHGQGATTEIESGNDESQNRDSIAVQSTAGVCKLGFYYIVSSYSN